MDPGPVEFRGAIRPGRAGDLCVGLRDGLEYAYDRR